MTHARAIAGRGAWVCLLGSTSLGTISSTLMSAPINDIARDLSADPQEVVLAVSAFTIAMVVFAPFAGWLSDRYGATTVLVASLIVMVLAQVGAALASSLWMLVLLRAVQGVGCSGIPPVVQQGLTSLWPHRRRQAMAAWATAIGVGQAIGPPAGGVITELFGWRALFGIHAAVCAGVACAVYRQVPHLPPRPAELDLMGMTHLVAGAGALVVGATWVGQGGDARAAAAVICLGVLVLGWALRPGWTPRPLLGEGVMRDPSYVIGTVAAAAAMATMGITLVSVPLYLGREVGLSAGVIGATTFAVAAGMASFAPVASRIASRIGTTRTLAVGLVMLLTAPLMVTAVEGIFDDQRVVAPMVIVLLLVGCGIATVQSMSALVMLGSQGGRHGLAVGVHNMGRFSGLALGYAWVAGVYAAGAPTLVHLGSALAAGATLAAGILIYPRR